MGDRIDKENSTICGGGRAVNGARDPVPPASQTQLSADGLTGCSTGFSGVKTVTRCFDVDFGDVERVVLQCFGAAPTKWSACIP